MTRMYHKHDLNFSLHCISIKTVIIQYIHVREEEWVYS